MAAVKTFEILCPNGRRQKVKATMASTVLHLLEECCKKQGYNVDDFDLKHQRTVLDTTTMIRFSNVPNNAKLEMIKRSSPRKAAEVLVALQLESGDRLQESFPPSSTMYDVIKKFDNSRNTLLRDSPVCIYMGNEVKGEKALKHTKLQDLGLVSGRAVIRLIHREKQEEEDKDQDTKDPSKPEDEAMTTNEVASHQKETRQESHQTSHREVLSKDSTMTEMSTDQDSVVEKQLSSSADNSCEKVSNNAEAPEGKKPKLIHDGEDSFRRIVSPFADFKFPERRFKQEECNVAAIDPAELRKEVELSMPCDRHALLFNTRDSEEVKDDEAENLEPSDDFFDVTVEDLRKMLRDLKSEREHLADAPLMTSAMRSEQESLRLQQYSTVVLRAYFPSGLALQGCFRPLETISAVTSFVKEYVKITSASSIYLYTTPPRCVLKDPEMTLDKAKLFPTAIVYVGSSNNAEGDLLKEECMDSIVSRTEAEVAVYNTLRRNYEQAYDATSQPSDGRITVDTPAQTSSGHRDGGVINQGPSASNNAPRVQSTKPKVPKWLKLGK